MQGKPDEVEPDVQPNARNIPISSLQSNICYHRGLAYYLKGEFDRALPIYQRCAIEARNPDRLVSVSHWLYMTLRRLGRQKDAEHVLEAIEPGLDVIENTGYHKLLLMYRGAIAPEELVAEKTDGNDHATIFYGVVATGTAFSSATFGTSSVRLLSPESVAFITASTSSAPVAP